MIVDHVKNMGKYPQLEKYAKKITEFIERCGKESLADGRYDLLADNELFALLQHYEAKPKESGRMESHEKYADVQYVLSGKEIIYYDLAEKLTISEDKRPESDVIFYENGEDMSGNILTEGMFAYYAPQDAHMPGISHGEAAKKVGKIVFKVLCS